MNFPRIHRLIRKLKAVFGIEDREQRSFKTLQNANKSFAISVTICDPGVPAAINAAENRQDYTSDAGKHFSWKHTWSTNRDVRQPQRFRSAKVKGKMYAVPCNGDFKA